MAEYYRVIGRQFPLEVQRSLTLTEANVRQHKRKCMVKSSMGEWEMSNPRVQDVLAP